MSHTLEENGAGSQLAIVSYVARVACGTYSKFGIMLIFLLLNNGPFRYRRSIQSVPPLACRFLIGFGFLFQGEVIMGGKSRVFSAGGW